MRLRGQHGLTDRKRVDGKRGRHYVDIVSTKPFVFDPKDAVRFTSKKLKHQRTTISTAIDKVMGWDLNLDGRNVKPRQKEILTQMLLDQVRSMSLLAERPT